MRYAHHQLTETDVAYDLGYMMALCYALDRKPLADALLERYERYAF
jgi:aminoglycoside phosphotransferase family enzyme